MVVLGSAHSEVGWLRPPEVAALHLQSDGSRCCLVHCQGQVGEEKMKGKWTAGHSNPCCIGQCPLAPSQLPEMSLASGSTLKSRVGPTH